MPGLHFSLSSQNAGRSCHGTKYCLLSIPCDTNGSTLTQELGVCCFEFSWNQGLIYFPNVALCCNIPRTWCYSKAFSPTKRFKTFCCAKSTLTVPLRGFLLWQLTSEECTGFRKTETKVGNAGHVQQVKQQSNSVSAPVCVAELFSTFLLSIETQNVQVEGDLSAHRVFVGWKQTANFQHWVGKPCTSQHYTKYWWIVMRLLVPPPSGIKNPFLPSNPLTNYLKVFNTFS